MPTYDYACRLCGHRFELFQGLSEKKKRKCPECGKPGLERLFGAGAGVIFKGSGFYETDYKKPAPKKEATKPEAPKKDVKGKDKGGGD